MPDKTTTARGHFIGMRKDQLGARLLMMLNTIRLAEDYDSDFRINWFPTGSMAPKLQNPQDLFSRAFIDSHFMANDDFIACQDSTKPLWAFANDRSSQKLNKHLASGGHVLLEEGFEIVVFPWEDQSDMQDRFRGYIDRIAFDPRVRSHMDKINQAMTPAKGQRTLAYHIRRGDILNEAPWKHKEWPAKIEPDELYAAHLQRNMDSTAFVYSDQAESIARFTDAHPQVRRLDDAVDLSDCGPAQRDFLELYAMSRASEIIAPPISAFSRAAARISGQERKCFHDVMTLEDREAAYEKVLMRFEQGVDNFITPSEAAQIYVKLSRRLQETNREQQAWDIGQSIINAGADNAFLPLLHAINGIYLRKWDQAMTYIDQALGDPQQWQENHISGLAIRAHILGALGRAKDARQSFLRAFWQKPIMPDVTVIGTFMVKRRRLRPGKTLPFDLATLDVLPVKYQQTNITLQQNKILVRRALDMSVLAVEWPWFVLDSKTKRQLRSEHALAEMQSRLTEHHNDIPGAGPYSFSALLEARMGRPEQALAMNTKAIKVAPHDPILHKRQAEFLFMTGDTAGALKAMEACRACAPDHAFWHFMEGRIHKKAGDMTAARKCLETACAMDDSTAELHARLSSLYKDLGETENAVLALGRAAEIAPNQQRYRNRLERLTR